MTLLKYLRSNISSNNSLDEIIDVFKEMCKTYTDDDLLINE